MSDTYQRLTEVAENEGGDQFVRDLALEALGAINEILERFGQLLAEEKWLAVELQRVADVETEPIGGVSAAYHRQKAIAVRTLNSRRQRRERSKNKGPKEGQEQASTPPPRDGTGDG